MDILTPNNTRKKNPKKVLRGAVLKKVEIPKEEPVLSIKKKIYDAFMFIRSIQLTRFYLLGFLVLLCVGMISVVVHRHGYKISRPIASVVVKGDFFQINKAELESTLSPLIGRNYFDTNITNIKRRLMNFAWIQSVQVRKVWPANLEVTIVENKAIATWGEDGLVNELGEIFNPKAINRQYIKGLPDLNGSYKESDLVLDTYVSLSAIAQKFNLTIHHFSLIANSYWQLQFSNDVQLMLSKGSEEKSLETFLHTYEQHFQYHEKQLRLVDARYNNGFSVRFYETEGVTTKAMEKQQKVKPKLDKTDMSYLHDLPMKSLLKIKVSMNDLLFHDKVGMHYG